MLPWPERQLAVLWISTPAYFLCMMNGESWKKKMKAEVSGRRPGCRWLDEGIRGWMDLLMDDWKVLLEHRMTDVSVSNERDGTQRRGRSVEWWWYWMDDIDVALNSFHASAVHNPLSKWRAWFRLGARFRYKWYNLSKRGPTNAVGSWRKLAS